MAWHWTSGKPFSEKKMAHFLMRICISRGQSVKSVLRRICCFISMDCFRLCNLSATFNTLHRDVHLKRLIADPGVMMTSSNGNIFRVTGPLWEEFTGVPLNSPHKGQWRGDLMFSLICVWINGWVNNHGAGDLRRYHAHYVITEMIPVQASNWFWSDLSILINDT